MERRRSDDSTQDSPALSLVRGRGLAALAAALNLMIAVRGLSGALSAYQQSGMSPELAGQVLEHSGNLFDASVFLWMGALAAISLIASAISKWRDRRPRKPLRRA